MKTFVVTSLSIIVLLILSSPVSATEFIVDDNQDNDLSVQYSENSNLLNAEDLNLSLDIEKYADIIQGGYTFERGGQVEAFIKVKNLLTHDGDTYNSSFIRYSLILTVDAHWDCFLDGCYNELAVFSYDLGENETLEGVNVYYYEVDTRVNETVEYSLSENRIEFYWTPINVSMTEMFAQEIEGEVNYQISVNSYLTYYNGSHYYGIEDDISTDFFTNNANPSILSNGSSMIFLVTLVIIRRKFY